MKSIRNLLVALTILMGFSGQATHIIGGDIQYEYLGNNRYYVKLVIYRQSASPVGLPATTNVYVTSSTCGISTSVPVTRTAQYLAPGAFDCIQQSSTVFRPEVNVYETTVSNPLTLATHCSDYKLFWFDGNRPNGITNIGNGTNSGIYWFYFEAELNNRVGIGTNSSPVFDTDPIAYYCANSFINYSQSASEPDGDSLLYTLIDPREKRGLAANVVNVPYVQPNFSAQNPITCSQAHPYQMDPRNGNISFEAIVGGEVSVVAMRVDEYRFDSTYFFWEKVGSSNREIQVVIASNCVPAVNLGVRLDPNAPGVSMDARGRQQKDYHCYDSTVTLRFTLPVECVSVAPDGTDFRLTAPNGQPIPVKGVKTYCNVDNETDSVTLQLYKPLIFNGDYFLYSKFGSDGNTLLNKCGKPMNEFDTIILKVADCLDPIYGIKGVKVDEDRRNQIDFFVDTNSIPTDFLDFVRIFRSDDSGKTYNQITTATPLQATVYDPAPGSTGVDKQYYYYAMDLIANGQAVGMSKGRHTIVLEGDVSDPFNIPLDWSSYAGTGFVDFPNIEFQLQWGASDGAGGYLWQNVTDVFPIKDSVYLLSLPENTPEGNYAVRVLTLMDAFGYESESNWLTFGIPKDPIIPETKPAIPVIPNAITPDNDGLNDAWTIDGIEQWTNRSVVIYDRWGRKVWSSDKYVNADAFRGIDMSGDHLSDGTYFYVIELSNPTTSQHETLNGMIQLMSRR